eukprot:CAMPEP_0180254334 /NCGR_PEP_ID=MMETSP0987-20121128/40114_1 /TAXON_ID=697907 /ORGANISM="non described non described, Strain CCMP2293" /LENGTH=86 /DNA_ID=CAMNT_0022223333 /DNA_START=168 /DNA_END=424 /DNA_ORIENTATION=+
MSTDWTPVVRAVLADMVTPIVFSRPLHADDCPTFAKLKRKAMHTSLVTPNRVKPGMHRQSLLVDEPPHAPVHAPIRSCAPELAGHA